MPTAGARRDGKALLVRRFDGRISDIVNQIRFGSAAELNQRCAITSRSTTTAFRNAPSNTKRPFRRSRNGRKNNLNCSGNACITSRVLTVSVPARPLVRGTSQGLGRHRNAIVFGAEFVSANFCRYLACASGYDQSQYKKSAVSM